MLRLWQRADFNFRRWGW